MKHRGLVIGIGLGAVLLGVAIARDWGGGAPRAPESEGSSGGTATITVNPSEFHQTIEGWEATLSLGWRFGPKGIAALADSAARDLGINRIILEAPGEHIETTSPGSRTSTNDDGDPYHIDSAGFHWAEYDERMGDWVLPLRSSIRAAGLPFYLIVNYVGMNATCAYQQADPREYAEFVQAVLEHTRATFDLEPDYWDLRNEPDNGSVHVTGPQLTGMLDSAVARIRPLGFTHIRFLVPSTADPNDAPPLASEVLTASGPAARDAIGQITYHRYAPLKPGTLARISSLAAGHGLSVGMNGYNGTNEHELYQDLTEANATAWQKFALAGPSSGNKTSGNQYYFADPRVDTIAMRPATFVLRQYFKYVPAGSVRLGAIADLGHVEPTAWRRPDGGIVVVANVTGATTLVIRGLPAGTYRVSFASDTAIGPVGPGVTLAAGETLTASSPTTGVITVSP